MNKKYTVFKILFILALSATSFNAISQIGSAIKPVYTAILKKIDGELPVQKNITIYHTITADIIKDLNFKHPNYYLRDTSAFHLERQFRQFLNKIKKKNIKDLVFDLDLSAIKLRHVKLTDQKGAAILLLSPVIISKDGKYAVCCYVFITRPNDSSPVVCFFKNSGNKWLLSESIKIGEQ